jgi:hypothetical protein
MSLFELSSVLRGIGVFCTAALFAAQTFASPIAIDTFNDAAPANINMIYPGVNSAFANAVGLDTNETAFGYRAVTLEADAPVTGAGFGNTAVAGGVFGFGTNTIVAPYTATATIEWSNTFSLDLIDNGGLPNDSFVVDFLSADHAGQLTLTVYNGPGTTVSSTQAFAAQESPFSLTLLYSGFTGAPGFDWTNVSQIDMALASTADGDYDIDYVGTTQTFIPEPASMSLIGLGMVALMRRRK